MNQKTRNKNTVSRKRNKKKKLAKTADVQRGNSFQTETFRVNRNFKDSLFRTLFDSREALLRENGHEDSPRTEKSDPLKAEKYWQ